MRRRSQYAVQRRAEKAQRKQEMRMNEFVSACASHFPADKVTVTRQELDEMCTAQNIKWPAGFVKEASNRVGRGLFLLPGRSPSDIPAVPAETAKPKTVKAKDIAIPAIPTVAFVPKPVQVNPDAISMVVATEVDSYVPQVDPTYVEWGHSKDIETIIASGKFLTVTITGHSGNGKSVMVEQACARTGREYIRLQMTAETDEDDLLGGMRAVGGETKFDYGPVIIAMLRGSILLLDEFDMATPDRISCLQSVLEGKGVYLKKLKKWIFPTPGFNVIATANTKGAGCETGRYAGVRVQNEAMLERYTVTLEQDYPDKATEMDIILRKFAAHGKTDKATKEFAEHLTDWSEATRLAFKKGSTPHVVTTRRLCDVASVYSVFGNRGKAVALCTSRFDADTKSAFDDLYRRFDPNVDGQTTSESSIGMPPPATMVTLTAADLLTIP